MAELLPIILSVALFFITLVIIITLRKADQKDRSISVAKQFVNKHLENIKRKDDDFISRLEDYEARFLRTERGMSALIAQIEEKREGLFTHVNELAELEGTLLHYHTVLTNLSELTAQAEERISFVQSEVDRLHEVEQLIEHYRTSVTESEQNLDHIEQLVHQRVSLFEEKVDAYAQDIIETTGRNLEEEKAQFVESMNPLLAHLSTLTLPLVESINRHLDDLKEHQGTFTHALSVSIDEASLRLDEMKGSQSLIRSDLEEVNREKGRVEEELGRIKTEIEQKQAVLHQLDGSIQESESNLSELSQRLSEERDELEGITSALASGRDSLEEVNREYESTNLSLESVRENLETGKSSLEEISQELESEKSSFEELSRKIESSEEMNEQLREEKEALEREIAEALRIQKELKEAEELALLKEREKIDYPDFDDVDYDEPSFPEEEGDPEESGDSQDTEEGTPSLFIDTAREEEPVLRGEDEILREEEAVLSAVNPESAADEEKETGRDEDETQPDGKRKQIPPEAPQETDEEEEVVFIDEDN